jgi:hypothetical protein
MSLRMTRAIILVRPQPNNKSTPGSRSRTSHPAKRTSSQNRRGLFAVLSHEHHPIITICFLLLLVVLDSTHNHPLNCWTAIGRGPGRGVRENSPTSTEPFASSPLIGSSSLPQASTPTQQADVIPAGTMPSFRTQALLISLMLAS